MRAEATLRIWRPGGYWAGSGRGGTPSLPGGVSRLLRPRLRPGRRPGFRARKPRGRQHRTRRARPSGAGGESGSGGLREEVTRRAWPWTWLESPGGIQGTQAPQGCRRERPRRQACVDSAPPWGPQRAAARTAFLYSRPACFSLFGALLPLPPPGYVFYHSLLD